MIDLKRRELRPYQLEDIAKIRTAIANGDRRICFVEGCGGGKTTIMGQLASDFVSEGKNVLVIVHRQELNEQTVATFASFGLECGVIAADAKKNYDLPVQIANVQTLVKRLHEIPTPDVIIYDEAHHIKADTSMRIVKKFSDSLLIGATATPIRYGNKGLGDVFKTLILGTATSELIRLGFLANYKYYAPTEVDLTGIRTVHGDYEQTALGRLMTREVYISDVVKYYKLYAKGKSAIVYCVNCEHARLVTEAFIKAGIVARYCDGETPKAERQQLIEDFRNNKVQILCNVNLFSEGLDVPNVSTVILARPTQSLTLHIQQSMRSMRPDPNDANKIALMIDIVGNYERHGMPDDNRNWSLDPKKQNYADFTPMKACPDCGLVVPARIQHCPQCGYEFYSNKLVEAKTQLRQVHSSLDKKLPIVRQFESFLRKAKRNDWKASSAVCSALKIAQSRDEVLLIAKTAGDYSKTLTWCATKQGINWCIAFWYRNSPAGQQLARY